jgi:hypothetical protein
MKTSVLAAAGIGELSQARLIEAVEKASGAGPAGSHQPWYRRTYRWGQTNITEADPANYDIDWWRAYWRRTRTQGIIVNAGGIVAYYPSQYPLQYRPKALGDRDLFGDLVRAAHADGLAVLARMDSNRVHDDFSKAHPDWLARDFNGRPYRAGDLYITCINSPYYDEWIPSILREIIDRTHPEGFTDNSWSGLGRGSICHCDHCARKFRAASGKALPQETNWNDVTYREWIRWNYERRLEVWDLNNRTTREAGGPDCLWVGMNSGSLVGQSQTFRDVKEICRRAEIILLDHQARENASGFQQNGETGRLFHQLLGWNKLIPESMALYQAGRPTFRKSSKPEPEVRLWVLEGIAGGIQTWWHHVGAAQEDRRQFRTIESLNRWHEANQEFLIDRLPVATVGLLWSQQNTDCFGRDHAEDVVELPARGIANALLRARIPFLPIHADAIEPEAKDLRLLILPNLGAISDAQLTSLRRFVERGGNLLVTGESTLFNEWGDARPDFGLAELMGVHLPEGRTALSENARTRQAAETSHTYLRLPANLTERHAVLAGFADTDILPFGGSLSELNIADRTAVALTFVPAFPIYPPETSWMREPQTSIPGLILNELANGSRIAYLPADLDRRFARDNLPDHGRLLANLVNWAVKDDLPVRVEGAGLIDAQLYRQGNRLILHLVNLTNAGTWRQPVEELIPIGPITVKVRLLQADAGKRVRLLVSNQPVSTVLHDGWIVFELKSLLDHELAVVG